MQAREALLAAERCQPPTALAPWLLLSQVDFNAKNEYDMINNYKVLQDVFNKLGLDKVG